MGFSKPLYEGIYNLAGTYFQGSVVSISDPENRDRIQVRVDTMSDNKENIPDDDLPWYSVAVPAGAGNTGSSKPNIDARVLVVFPDGDIYNGMVMFALAQKAAT